MSKRQFIRAALALVLAWALLPAAAQTFPSRPVRLVIPFTPGGGADALGRLVAQKLAETWGHPVVVENRPGGATAIAAEFVAKSAPDGHTLLFAATETLAINPSLFPKLQYDPVRDFAMICGLFAGQHVLLVHPSVPAKTVSELVAYLKANPDKLSYGSPGNGSPSHLNMEHFKSIAGVSVQHIPYKGAAPATIDLLGGRIQMMLLNLALALPYQGNEKLKLLAVASETRSPLLPNLPTIAEGGYDGFESFFWFGLVAPAATPRAIIDKIGADAAAAVNLPEIREQKLAQQGVEAYTLGPEQFAARVRRDAAKFSRLIRQVGIAPD